MTTTVLALSGLSCGHCIKSVTKILENIPGVTKANVTLDQAIVEGNADPQAMIEAIRAEDFGAALAGETAARPTATVSK